MIMISREEHLKEKWAVFEEAFANQLELQEKEIGCSFPVQGHILLLKAIVLPEKTAGGIYLTEMTRDTNTSYDIGMVIGMGPEAYRDDEMFPNGPRCKVGDWIDFQPYEKCKKFYNGNWCFVIKDDRVNYPIPDISMAVKELR